MHLMPQLVIIATSILSFLSSLILTSFLAKYLRAKGFIDNPNNRSSHKIPTPRGGGLAILFSLTLAFLIFYIFGILRFHPSFYIAVLLIAILSFIDDKISLSAGIRFLIHIGSALLVIYYTGGLEKLPFPDPLNISLSWLGYPISLIWILGTMNIFNFLDGIDGYAGFQILIYALGLGLFFPGLWPLALVMGLSSIGFLFSNWHPAKIFMGDVGSASIGFIFAIIPFYISKNVDSPTYITVFYAVVFLWFFLSDGAFTIIRRIARGEKVWEAHRSHLYQRLNIVGWKHDKITILVALGQLLSLTLVWFLGFSWWSFLGLLILFLLFLTLVIISERSFLENEKSN